MKNSFSDQLTVRMNLDDLDVVYLILMKLTFTNYFSDAKSISTIITEFSNTIPVPNWDTIRLN